MTVGHNSNAALVTLKTVELIKKEYGVNTSITDPIKLGNSIKAINLLVGRDSNSIRYLKYFRAMEKLRSKEAVRTTIPL